MATASLARHDSMFDVDIPAIKSETITAHDPLGFFDLPAEIRTHIYNLVFDLPSSLSSAYHTPHLRGAIELNPVYRASSMLLPLLTSRQFHAEAHLLAFSRTLFVVTNPYIGLDIGAQLRSRLSPPHLAALRHIAFVADARHFRHLGRGWDTHTFGIPALDLDELSIVLRPTSYWHYLFDSNAALVSLLRDLQGTRRITFVRNGALIKGTMLTWYNRLVKLILKVDVAERFDRSPPVPETRWWSWEHDVERQMVGLRLEEAKKPDMEWEEYARHVGPLVEKLLVSMAGEEYDPDPMSRI